MNRKIIIALIIIVLIALAGLIVFSSGIKTDTQITFLSSNSLKNGEQVQFELKDAQGNALTNQNINIVFEDNNGEKQNFTITTDDQGRGGLLLNEQADGNYSITVSYDGDDKHNGCSANTIITIGEGTSETYDNSPSQTSSQSSSDTPSSSDSSSSDLNYDSELNEHYDSDGNIVGGQNDGMKYEDIKDNQPKIEDGNLE